MPCSTGPCRLYGPPSVAPRAGQPSGIPVAARRATSPRERRPATAGSATPQAPGGCPPPHDRRPLRLRARRRGALCGGACPQAGSSRPGTCPSASGVAWPRQAARRRNAGQSRECPSAWPAAWRRQASGTCGEARSSTLRRRPPGPACPRAAALGKGRGASPGPASRLLAEHVGWGGSTGSPRSPRVQGRRRGRQWQKPASPKTRHGCGAAMSGGRKEWSRGSGGAWRLRRARPRPQGATPVKPRAPATGLARRQPPPPCGSSPGCARARGMGHRQARQDRGAHGGLKGGGGAGGAVTHVAQAAGGPGARQENATG